MSNSEIEQSGTVKGHLPNEASLSGRISNGLSLSGHISIGGASDFIIKMTVESNGDESYTVISCDATVEQIDAAVAAEKRVVVIATQINSNLLWEMPIVRGSKGSFYYFGTFLQGEAIAAFVLKDGDESGWLFVITQIKALNVDYSNNAIPNISTVEEALNVLVPKSHTHANKDTLDKLSDSNGKLKYNGSDVGPEGDGSTYYVELNGNYPNYTLSETTSLADIAAAYNEGKALFCRCTRDSQTVTLPLFGSIPESSVWVFSGSVGVGYIDLPAQYFSIFVSHLGVMAENKMLNQQLKITVGNTEYLYDGSEAVNVDMDGITPTIGTNGNWFLGTTDTGKPSRGEKGDKGDTGAAGADGYTPVKGTDYWTAADKAEIVNDTLAALPTWTGGSY